MMESDNLAFANLYYLHSIKEFLRLAYLSFGRFVSFVFTFLWLLNRCFYDTKKTEVKLMYCTAVLWTHSFYTHTKKNRQLNSVNVRHSIRKKVNRSMFTNRNSNCSLLLGLILFSGFNLANIGTSCSVLNEIVCIYQLLNIR